MKLIRAAIVLFALSSPAFAGSIAVTPGSGTTVGAGSDGTNQIPAAVICGATSGATLYATCLNQVFVNASGQMGVTGPVTQSGTWNITNISGTISLPTGASTSALQTTGNTVLTIINTTLGSPMQQTGGTVGITGTVAVTGGAVTAAITHTSTTALATTLNAKNTSAQLFGFNCTAITGGAAGFCIAYNGATTPSTGALTGANVLDFCYFDTTARGCSLGRAPTSAPYSAGVQILVTSAATPYTYTTGTDTAAISADVQ